MSFLDEVLETKRAEIARWWPIIKAGSIKVE